MDRWIEIPEAVRDQYRLYRSTPLVRAYGLEKALDTPAHIYFKNESVSPVGSHKLNSALAQAYYCKQEGLTNITTETGAGQWGTALAYAANVFGLELAVYMVKLSYEQKPYRRSLMQVWGAQVVASPSMSTKAGRRILTETPNHQGSLGTAISEAVELATTVPGCKYTLGSVLNHVTLHQTVIGLEAEKQMEMAGEWPDVVIGCFGGGSNFGGISYPFMRHCLGENMRERGLWLRSRKPARNLRKGSSCTTMGTRPAILLCCRCIPWVIPSRPQVSMPEDSAITGPGPSPAAFSGKERSRQWISGRKSRSGPESCSPAPSPHRGHRAGSRVRSCNSGDRKGSHPGEGGRHSQGNPVLPLRSRDGRHGGLRQVPDRGYVARWRMSPFIDYLLIALAAADPAHTDFPAS